MPRIVRTITPTTAASYLERVAILIAKAALWPLGDDQRMTVLLSLLCQEVIETMESEQEIEHLIDLLRTRLLVELRP